ncbi:hypothetical protein BJV82DRAFT_246867 [Fennellomyces sp. T-0311]|nr:hypothetical protein BJV82DRAFT_246867 [Fennellomyces sp. T-0311]
MMSAEAHHQRFVLISSGESYIGHALARYMAREIAQHPGKMKKHWRVRVLCQRLQGMEDLIEAGVDVQQVNYEEQATLRQQMRHVRSVVILPIMSENRVPHTMNVINSASLEDVKRIQMVSLMGAEYAEDRNSPIGQYHQLEEHLRNTFAYGRWCIFRPTFLHQANFLWNAMIQQRGIIGMPLPPDAKSTSIDLQDLCDAVATYILSPKKQDIDEEDVLSVPPPTAVKRIYELTGPCVYTNEDVAEQLNHALEGEEGEITYQEISEDEMREYLQSIPSHRPGAERPPLHPNLSDALIDFLMDGFKLAKHFTFDKVTDDLRDLTGREPLDLAQFFIENRNEFRRPDSSK